MRFQSAGRTEAGRRSHNEDAFCSEPELGLFAVADGVGGYEGGEIASRLAIDSLLEFFRRNAADPDATWPFKIDPGRTLCENLLVTSSRLAHRAICARKAGRLSGMGSTIASLLLCDGRAVVAHLGDSRVYRLRAHQLEALTRDHSLWAEMVAAGTSDFSSRAGCPYGHVITRALGLGEGDGAPELRSLDVSPGDVFLVCSDGVSEPVPEDVIAATLASREPDAACEFLNAEALRRGGRDNVTAVVVRAL